MTSILLLIFLSLSISITQLVPLDNLPFKTDPEKNNEILDQKTSNFIGSSISPYEDFIKSHNIYSNSFKLSKDDNEIPSLRNRSLLIYNSSFDPYDVDDIYNSKLYEMARDKDLPSIERFHAHGQYIANEFKEFYSLIKDSFKKMFKIGDKKNNKNETEIIENLPINQNSLNNKNDKKSDSNENINDSNKNINEFSTFNNNEKSINSKIIDKKKKNKNTAIPPIVDGKNQDENNSIFGSKIFNLKNNKTALVLFIVVAFVLLTSLISVFVYYSILSKQKKLLVSSDSYKQKKKDIPENI